MADTHYLHATLGDDANWPALSELLPIKTAAAIVWGAAANELGAGDTLLFGGTLTARFTPGASGTDKDNMITIDGSWSGDTGEIDLSGGGTVGMYLNGVSYINCENFDIPHEGGTASVFFAGTTAGNILSNLGITTKVGRGIYAANNAHTDWEINDCDITVDVATPGNTQAVYMWGNNATAGVGGVISNLTVNGIVDYLKTNSNHVGLHVDDWNGMLVEGYTCIGMHTGLRVTNSDSNRIVRPDIRDCGLGLKSDATGDGYGVTFDASSANNEVIAGRFDDNYQHYVDATTSGGGNKLIGSLLTNPLVNSVSIVSTSDGVAEALNNIIIHDPADTEGHGLVVQNGGVTTKAILKNNIVVCNTTGTNVQCVAVGGVSGTNYDLVTLDHNCYYTTNSALVGKLGVTEYTTLANWITAITADVNIDGNEGNSIEANPLLGSDYKLTASSPCLGIGALVASGTDTYDQPIPAFGVDIGNQSTHGPFHPVNL